MSLKSWEIREEQVRADVRKNIALELLKDGKYTLPDIADICSLTLDRVNELASSIQP